MKKIKVLTIDDNPVIIRLNESLLRSEGYEVLSATDGMEGLIKARDAQPDVIFLDVILPGMHGFELYRELKKDARTRSIPVVYVTASGLEDVADSEPAIRAEGYIVKPYGIKELNEAIAKVLPAPREFPSQGGS